MLGQLLAVMVAAALAPPDATATPQTPGPAPASSAAKTVSPVTVSPLVKPPPADAKIDMQGSDDDINQLLVVWPETARQVGLGGRVTLRCLVDVHGLAESCEVAYESPAGKGFGRAALKMRHTFKLAPTLGPDGPVNAIKNISITFSPPQLEYNLADLLAGRGVVTGNPVKLHLATEITDPVWTKAASFDDLAGAYPAKAEGAEGYAAARCRARRDGALEACEIIKEAPEGQGFGRAALHLAETRFKVDPHLAAHQVNPVLVDVPIRFPSRQELSVRTVAAPTWLTALDPKATPKLFPPEAIASGLTSGRGVARCVVAADGALTECKPEKAEPDGLGFAEAAARLASTLKVNLWSADDAPVEGGVIYVPVRLNLKTSGG